MSDQLHLDLDELVDIDEGTKCWNCGKGRYARRSLNDEWYGNITCDNCYHQIDSTQRRIEMPTKKQIAAWRKEYRELK
jgi:hypothetical protein